MKDKKSLIVYFSYTGNTRQIANKIKKVTGYDVLELEPMVPYSEDYQTVVDREEEKMDREEIILLKPIDVNLEEYDHIILGSPVWWYTVAPPVRSFLLQNDLSNKEIISFITNGGWVGHSFEDIKRYATNSVCDKYINLVFDGNVMKTKIEELDEFIGSL